MIALVAVLGVVAVAAWAQPRVTTVVRDTRVAPAHRRRRQPPTSAEQWAALLDSMAAEARTGATPATAHEVALAAAPWCRYTARPGDDETLVAHTVQVVRALGGPVAATLDAGAALLRERVAIRAEVAAHSAQARLSIRVLTLVPIGFCGWCLLTSVSFRRAWAGPAGLACAAVGGSCNLLGWWWMRRILAGAQR